MKKQLWGIAGAMVMLWLSLVCVTGIRVHAAQAIQVKGSDTMINLWQDWAEIFMKKTHIRVTVTGGGSGNGFAALINKVCDVAEASRSIKPNEIANAKRHGVSPNETIMAWDGISVIVNPKNPVSRLTEAQLADIYTGRVTNWHAVGGANAKIVVLARDTMSGTYDFFRAHVIQHGDAKSSANYSRDAFMEQSNQEIHDEVAGNPRAIGYVGMGYLTASVRPLALAAAGKPYVLPSVNTVRNKTYPLSRPFYWYTNGKPQGAIKQLVDFALSKEGQAIVAKLGFVPLN